VEYKPAILFRLDFQKLADRRLEEAKCLLQAGFASGAYYLAGYAVESALKACIAKLVREHQFPPDRKTIEKYYQHDLTKLLEASGLNRDLDSESDSLLKENWGLVKDWNSEVRYCTVDTKDARDLFDAVSDPNHGVLEWVRKHW